MLSGGGGILATVANKTGEINATNIDVKTGRRSPSGVGSGGSLSKGGGFVNVPNISPSPSGLNPDAFFAKAVTGVGDTGEYLTKAERVADFRKSQQMRAASAGAPSITPDSGVDIVAAVNRNTQMIVSLVEAVKAQTKNDSNLVEKQIQGQETLMLRGAAREEEAQLEQGSDLSGFMTPENFEKKKKQEKKKEEGSKLKEFFKGPNPFKKDGGCGCSPFMPGPGGRGPILGGPPGGGGLPFPDFVDEYRDMNRRPGSRLGGGGSVTRRVGGGRRATRLATKIGGKGAGKAVAKGLGKFGAKRIPGLGLLAGIAFGAERAMKGDFLGAAGEVASGALGPAGFAIDAGLAARDAGLTPFANGGIVTSPVAGLVGEAGNEGIFPLEGKRGEKTFRMFGEGVFQAQKDNDKDFAKLQSMGLKQYYEREGGFKKMGEGLKDFFANLAGGIASLFGGAANAATLDQNYLGGGDFSGSSGQDQAMNYFMSQGMSKEQAAGIVGNLMQESGAGLDPKANNGTHRGIAQWDANRWAGFEKFAKQKGLDVNTREAQLQWIMEEMRTGSGGLGIKRFKQTKTAEEAAALFLTDYERSGEKPGQHGYDNRLKNARALAARQISGGGGGTGGSKLERDILSFRQARTKFGVSGNRVASDSTFNLAVRELRGAKGGSSINPLADDLSYQDVHKGRAHKEGYGFDIPVGNKEQASFVIDFFRSRGYETIHGRKEDATGGHDHHVHVQAPHARAKEFMEAMKPKPKPQAPQGVGKPTPAATQPYRGGGRSSGSSPGSLQASAANPNTGTPMMATSQQVAMASMGGGTSPTIVNNYYTSSGGNGGVNPNGVSPGIGMRETGTDPFQELRLRALA